MKCQSLHSTASSQANGKRRDPTWEVSCEISHMGMQNSGENPRHCTRRSLFSLCQPTILCGTEDHPGGFDIWIPEMLNALLELEPSHVSVPNPFHPWILLETITPFETTPHFLASISGSRVEKSLFHRRFGYGSIPIHTISRGMNIHLPAILMFTRGIGFWPIPIWVGQSSLFFFDWWTPYFSWLNPTLCCGLHRTLSWPRINGMILPLRPLEVLRFPTILFGECHDFFPDFGFLQEKWATKTWFLPVNMDLEQ